MKRTISEYFEKPNITKELLDTIKVGDKVRINNWRAYFDVVAVSKNYFIMTRPVKDTFLYSICEKNKRGYEHNLCYQPKCGFSSDEFVCGADDHWCKYDYSKKNELKLAIKELEEGELKVSTKRGLGIKKIYIKRGK